MQALAATALCSFTLATFCITSAFSVERTPEEMNEMVVVKRGDEGLYHLFTEMKDCISSFNFLVLFVVFSLGDLSTSE